jgi:hypothetical protein
MPQYSVSQTPPQRGFIFPLRDQGLARPICCSDCAPADLGYFGVDRRGNLCHADGGDIRFASALSRACVAGAKYVDRECLERRLGQRGLCSRLGIDLALLVISTSRTIGVAPLVDVRFFSHHADRCDRRTRNIARTFAPNQAPKHRLLDHRYGVCCHEFDTTRMDFSARLFWFGLHPLRFGCLAASAL